MELLAEAVKHFGLPIALVIFFVWQNYKDKAQMNARFDALDKFCREDLVKVNLSSIQTNTECVQALDKCNKCVDENTKVLTELKAYLQASRGGLNG